MEKALTEVCRKEIRKKSEVVTEALRLYFGPRGGKPQLFSLVMPTGEERCPKLTRCRWSRPSVCSWHSSNEALIAAVDVMRRYTGHED